MKIILNTKHLTITTGLFRFAVYDKTNKHLAICVKNNILRKVKFLSKEVNKI